MKIINCIQGDDHWHENRAQTFNASDAPAMLGVSKHQNRSELLKEKATGIILQVDGATQKRFDRGHAAEAAARPIAEKIIGEELFPITATEEIEGMTLGASLDGTTATGEILFEHKLYSEDLAKQIKAAKIEPHYAMQMEQQLMVTGADKVLFACSDGTEDNFVWMWYTRVRGRDKKIIAGWRQFSKDLAEYQHVEAAVVPEGRAPETLPALHIELTGLVKSSNLDEFKEVAMAAIDNVNTNLQTDADFADAKAAVKWLREVERRLDAAKQHALSQMASIDEFFRAMDTINGGSRTKRLNLEKIIKQREQAIRVEIQQEAAGKLRAHYEQINTTLQRVKLGVPADFGPNVAAAMKGKKSITSLRDAADTALAQAKIAASEQAELTRINLQVLEEHKDHASLFPDFASLVTTKAADDFKAIVTSRIAEHKAAEDLRRKREEQERQAQQEVPAPQEAPAPQVVQPAPQAARTMAKASTEPERPTDAQIIGALSAHFHVDASVVIEWLREMAIDRIEWEAQ